jgi:hypothetical protein
MTTAARAANVIEGNTDRRVGIAALQVRWRSMAVLMMSGLAIASLLTLLFVPSATFYLALASARYSRCRDTAAMISRPKNAPTRPSTNTRPGPAAPGRHGAVPVRTGWRLLSPRSTLGCKSLLVVDDRAMARLEPRLAEFKRRRRCDLPDVQPATSAPDAISTLA